ncbi:IMP dehydrogenase [Leuconostocaceae bacterium ESL0723]|nr:IMP dehydrogenase [Leuconostocaceae bacterium ESL0723]
MTDNKDFHGLGYDQTLLVPAESNVLPHMVSLATTLAGFKLNIPLLSNALDLSDDDYALPTALNGGLGIIASERNLDEQVGKVKAIKDHQVDFDTYPQALVNEQKQLKIGAEAWLVADAQERIDHLVEAGADAILLYLDTDLGADQLQEITTITKQHPDTLVLVGLVEDPEVARKLYQAGVDGVLAGRSINSALPNDSHYPFLTVTMQVAEVAADFDGKAVVAAGGIHYSGDVVKALAGGADAVMITDYLAGDESADDAIFQIDGGLRAGMGYTGSATVADLKAKAQFVQITDNGLRESHPHDVEITKQAPNYVEQERD